MYILLHRHWGHMYGVPFVEIFSVRWSTIYLHTLDHWTFFFISPFSNSVYWIPFATSEMEPRPTLPGSTQPEDTHVGGVDTYTWNVMVYVQCRHWNVIVHAYSFSLCISSVVLANVTHITICHRSNPLSLDGTTMFCLCHGCQTFGIIAQDWFDNRL